MVQVQIRIGPGAIRIGPGAFRIGPGAKIQAAPGPVFLLEGRNADRVPHKKSHLVHFTGYLVHQIGVPSPPIGVPGPPATLYENLPDLIVKAREILFYIRSSCLKR